MIREFYYFNPRLTERLNRIRRRPLTVVSAHKASGKNTAIKAYLLNLKGQKLWHSITEATVETWLADLLAYLASEIPGFDDAEQYTEEILHAQDPVSALAVMLLRHKPEEPLFYVLEMCEDMNEEVLRFLYRLASRNVRDLVLIVLTSAADPGGFGRETDSRVNYISEEYFLFDQTDIRNSFSEKGIGLSEEEAALLFAATGGWAPLVSDLFHQVDHRGKTRVWKSLPNRFVLWREKMGRPAELGYSDELCRVLARLGPAETFTLEEAEAACEDPEADLFEILAPGKLPPFLYYDTESGLYHLHWLMREEFEKSFRRLPQKERERCEAAISAPPVDETECIAALEKAENDILAMDPEAAYRTLRGLRLSSKDCAAETECRRLILETWSETLCGRAQKALSDLEEELHARYASGRYREGELLTLGSVMTKLLLGNEYQRNTELFSVWTPRRNLLSLGRSGDLLLLVRALRLFREEDMGQLENLLEKAEVGEGRVELICRLLLAFARANQKQTEEAKAYVREALEAAVRERCLLPFVLFYDRVFPLLPEKCGAKEKAFLDEVRRRVNQHRRNMRKNFQKKQDAYGADLTRRETEAAELAADGLTNKEIALRMHVSENTIKTMLRQVFRKLNIEKRRELRGINR